MIENRESELFRHRQQLRRMMGEDKLNRLIRTNEKIMKGNLSRFDEILKFNKLGIGLKDNRVFLFSMESMNLEEIEIPDAKKIVNALRDWIYANEGDELDKLHDYMEGWDRARP